ncbi:RNA polymerase sigma factor [Rubritalea tangerina]|uniref:RNA polymerase sigma factor n=1 Tax=Rubritalea tangerina TaxID=430798 RepID=A0ABW4ZEN5_9BACT
MTELGWDDGSPMEDTRQTLIIRLQSLNDDEAWSVFHDAYSRYIYAVLRRVGIPHEDTGDLQQMILVKLWKKIPGYEYQPDRAMFRTWLGRVIKNTAIDWIRGKKPEGIVFDESVERSVMREEVLDTIIQKEWQTYVSNVAMQNVRRDITEQSVEIFELSLKGVDADEIAVQYGLKRNSVYRIIARVRERLVVEINEIRRELE